MALFISLSAGNAEAGPAGRQVAMGLAGGSARACLVLFMGSAPGPAPEGSADPAGPQPGGNQPPRREQAALLQRLRHVLAPSSQAPRDPRLPASRAQAP